MNSQRQPAPKYFSVYNNELKDFTKVFFRDSVTESIAKQLDNSCNTSTHTEGSCKSPSVEKTDEVAGLEFIPFEMPF